MTSDDSWPMTDLFLFQIKFCFRKYWKFCLNMNMHSNVINGWPRTIHDPRLIYYFFKLNSVFKNIDNSVWIWTPTLMSLTGHLGRFMTPGLFIFFWNLILVFLKFWKFLLYREWNFKKSQNFILVFFNFRKFVLYREWKKKKLKSWDRNKFL